MQSVCFGQADTADTTNMAALMRYYGWNTRVGEKSGVFCKVFQMPVRL